jgi:hypothetical protein
MSQATPPAAASANAAGVRIVLFGMPDAGKSSLLGALAQAAHTQEHVLNGRLLDQTHGLVELQRRLYEERPRQTLEEVAPFPVRLEPFPARGSATAPPPVDAVLFDCDGRVANDLLNHQDSLAAGDADGALARAVLEADTLVLVVDAASDPAVLKRDFGQFALFLRLLEQHRGQRSEVGGLPVYLVLTKCDLLARPDDNAATWMDRIEERKRQVDRGFQEFLAQQAEREHMPFGKIELHLWATAVKRPALADAPARPRDPYGVAELFRQCLGSAVAFEHVRRRAHSRLKLIVGLVGGVVAAMLLLTLFLVLSRPSKEEAELTAEATRLRSALLGVPADRRLRGPLEDRIKELEKIRQSKYFPSLPKDLQEFVADTLKEFEAYHAYAVRLREAANTFGGDVKTLDNEEDLDKAKAALEKVPPPPRYQADWGQTAAVADWKRWLGEVKALDVAVRHTRTGYEKLLEDAKRLKRLESKKGISLDELADRAKEAWDRWKKLPQRKGDADRLIPGAEGATYAQVFAFPSVAEVYEAWMRSGLQETVAFYAKKRL